MILKPDAGASEAQLEQVELISSNVLTDMSRMACYKLDDLNSWRAGDKESEPAFRVRREVVKSGLTHLIRALNEQLEEIDLGSHLYLGQGEVGDARARLLADTRRNALHSVDEGADDIAEDAIDTFMETAGPAAAMTHLPVLQDASLRGLQQLRTVLHEMFDELEHHRLGADTPTVEFERKRALEGAMKAFKECCAGELGFMQKPPRGPRAVLAHAIAEVYIGHLGEALDMALHTREEFGERRQLCGSILLELGVPQPMRGIPNRIPDGPASRQILEVMLLASTLRNNLEEGVLVDRALQVFEEHYESKKRNAPEVSEADYHKALAPLNSFQDMWAARLLELSHNLDGWTDNVTTAIVRPENIIKAPPRIQ